jgi:CubicO group peptidase (beta-lactamase class C family)
MSNSKPKSNFLVGIAWAIAILVVSSMLAIWITGYNFIYKTLIYTYPGIDDIEIFDTRIVNDSGPEQWPVSAFYNTASLPAALTSELEKYESVAYLIIRDDSIIHEQYWDGYGDKSLSNSFSVSKSIVGVLTGIALKEGLFSLDDSVGKYIPHFSKEDNAKLRIRHLLTMSSGLNWDESYNSLFSATTEAYYGTNLERQVTRLKVVEEPGKNFRYMSCNTVLLALVIAKTSGMSISSYATEKLWKKIGATQPAYWSLDHFEGLEKSYCCFYSTARDFAKIGKLYLDSGRWKGERIVPINYVLESVSPMGAIDGEGRAVDYYGYHWWMMNSGKQRVFYARGILGQYIIVVPEERMIIVRLGKLRGEKNKNSHYNDMITYTEGALSVFGRNK